MCTDLKYALMMVVFAFVVIGIFASFVVMH